MASARPTPKQIEYQDWEFGLFLHFGIRTFHEGHRDWDGKPMPAQAFDPTDLDCDQWVRTAKAAGARYMVLTAKHHDGFANWPSAFTDYSVAAAPWQDGKGDVMRDYTEACRRHGMAVGMYYSPADATLRTCTDSQAYNEYFLGQIRELVSGYGPLDILWFDGCGSTGVTYDWERVVREIRSHQPDVLLFNMGDPDFRWVGNEAGVAPMPCWNTVDRVPVAVDTGDDERVGEGVPTWLPAECDCRLRLRNWFYSDHDEDTIKGVDELLGLYYYSVGRGCNLLLNVGPDRRGLIPDRDTQRLIELGQALRDRFGAPLATLADTTHPEPNEWVYAPPERLLVDHVVVQEDIQHGEHIRRFAVEIQPGRDWVTLHEGQNVGHKAICRFPPIAATKLRMRVIDAEGEVKLRALELHGPRQVEPGRPS